MNQNLRVELADRGLFKGLDVDPQYEFLKKWLKRMESTQKKVNIRLEELEQEELMEGMFE